MNVHSSLGNGFEELVYQEALGKEMNKLGLKAKREYQMDLLYNGERMKGGTVDFFVENCIVVDVFSLTHFDSFHMLQAKSNLEAYNIEMALLFNFGTENLHFKRVINSSFKKP